MSGAPPPAFNPASAPAKPPAGYTPPPQPQQQQQQQQPQATYAQMPPGGQMAPQMAQQPGVVYMAAPAQPVGYQQGYQPQGAVMATPVYTQPGAAVVIAPVVMQTRFPRMPVQCQCANCRQTIVTATRPQPGLLTWLSCGGLALFGCIFGCCLIPFCVPDLQDVVHTCPSCGTVLGIHEQMSM